MKEDIKNRNSKKQLHGYQEWYSYCEPTLRGIFKHGLEIGYGEFNYAKQTNFYIR